MPKRFAKCLKHGFYTALYLFIFAIIASCGGGGGGGGAVSFSPDSNMPHNGGDAGGWGTGAQTGGGFGGSNIGDDNTTLLIGQIAALDVENINIVLYVNGERFEINNVTETTTKEVLPEMSVGDIVYGTAYISVAGENDPREAPLDQTTIGFDTSLKFKVPYNYTIAESDLPAPVSGTYFARNGIDMSSYTAGNKVGWKCTYSDGTTTDCYSALVTGVRGDVTLTSIKECLWLDADGALHFTDTPGNPLPANLVIPSSVHGKPVKKVAAEAFFGNTTLTSVTIPAGMIVEEKAFKSCTNLTSITVGNNATVGIQAFDLCSAVTLITVGNNVSLGDFSFGSAGSNTNLVLTFNKGSGVLFNGAVLGYSTVNNPDLSNVIFPGNYLPGLLFCHCPNLGVITIPSSINRIGTSCFSGATFDKVYIPIAVSDIESYAFDLADGEIYYQGTATDWANITIDSLGNGRLGNIIPIHYESW